MKKYFFIFLSVAFSQIFSQDFNIRLTDSDYLRFPEITSYLQIYKSDGQPITIITDFKINLSIDGKITDSLKIKTIEQKNIGINILLCIDLSGSMSGRPLETIKSSLIGFINQTRVEDKIALMGFANDTNLITDFTNDKVLLKNKINSLKTSGTQTALFYATNKALQKLKAINDNNRKILILMGDGKNESTSPYTDQDIINTAVEYKIPVFSVGYTRIDRLYLQYLERLSEKSGGNFYEISSDEDLNQQFIKLLNQIKNIYVLSSISTDIEGDGKDHNLTVTVESAGIKKSVSTTFIAPICPDCNKIPLWYYYTGGGIALLLIGLITYLILRNKRKKKELELERQKLEAELKKKAEEKEELFGNEIKKRERLEKEVQDLKKNKESDKTILEGRRISDKTIILGASSAFQKMRLEVLVGDFSGKRFEISSNGATIGKAEDNSISINDPTISKHHARIMFKSGLFFIEDLDSSNGTFINGVKIRMQQLNHNDTFKFGKCEGTVTLF